MLRPAAMVATTTSLPVQQELVPSPTAAERDTRELPRGRWDHHHHQRWAPVHQRRHKMTIARFKSSRSTVGAQNARTRCAFDRHAPMHVEQPTAIRRRSYEFRAHESRHFCPINEHLAWD
jgi:hypothetical protein